MVEGPARAKEGNAARRPSRAFSFADALAKVRRLGEGEFLATEQLKTYARRIRDLLRANPNTPEPGLAPAFQQLLTDLLPTLPAVPPLTLSPEFNNPGVGRPDIALIRPGQPAPPSSS